MATEAKKALRVAVQVAIMNKEAAEGRIKPLRLRAPHGLCAPFAIYAHCAVLHQVLDLPECNNTEEPLGYCRLKIGNMLDHLKVGLLILQANHEPEVWNPPNQRATSYCVIWEETSGADSSHWEPALVDGDLGLLCWSKVAELAADIAGPQWKPSGALRSERWLVAGGSSDQEECGPGESEVVSMYLQHCYPLSPLYLQTV